MLFIVIVMYILYVRASVSDMELALSAAKERVSQQLLINNDLTISLEQSEYTLERMARAKLNYARADERIFVDSSSIVSE